MAAYHQYYAVNAAVLSTIRASAVNADSPAEVALRQQGRNSKDLVNAQNRRSQSGRSLAYSGFR